MRLLLLLLHWADFIAGPSAPALQVYAAGDKSVITKDVGGRGSLAAFTEAVIKRL